MGLALCWVPHEKDTFSPQVVHSVTKEAHLAQVEQQNKAGMLHHMAWSEDAGDQRPGRSAGHVGKATHPELSANAWPRTSVEGTLATAVIIVTLAKGHGSCASSIARADGAASWPSACH